MKTKLTLKNGGEIELADERILCNDVRLPHDGWISAVDLQGPRDWQLIARFAEARGEGKETL